MKCKFRRILLLICDVSVLFSSSTEILDKKLAGGSFDLPTSGLWAQHASTAPSCWRYNVMRTLDLVLWFVGNECKFRRILLLICDVSVLFSSSTEILDKKLAGGSFDLPTSGLWSQHASTELSC